MEEQPYSPTHTHLLSGIEKEADSIIWDAHKMMLVHICTAVLFKDARHHSIISNKKGSYVFHEQEVVGTDTIPLYDRMPNRPWGPNYFGVSPS